jgi:formamidopyrimidine-DNA glycosylase
VCDPDADIADVLLDQRVAAGVGNVFKSEALFAVGIHPLTPIGALDGSARRRLWTTAQRQLRANAGPGPRRTTVTNHGLAVYGRHHGGCPRCDGAIEYAPAGPNASSRSSYWCPACQPPPS